MAWLARKLDVKLKRFKNLLATNKRNSHITTESYQNIYDFWLSKSLLKKQKNISKLKYLRNLKNMKDPDIQEKEKCLKNGTKKGSV